MKNISSLLKTKSLEQIAKDLRLDPQIVTDTFCFGERWVGRDEPEYRHTIKLQNGSGWRVLNLHSYQSGSGSYKVTIEDLPQKTREWVYSKSMEALGVRQVARQRKAEEKARWARIVEKYKALFHAGDYHEELMSSGLFALPEKDYATSANGSEPLYPYLRSGTNDGRYRIEINPVAHRDKDGMLAKDEDGDYTYFPALYFNHATFPLSSFAEVFKLRRNIMQSQEEFDRYEETHSINELH